MEQPYGVRLVSDLQRAVRLFSLSTGGAARAVVDTVGEGVGGMVSVASSVPLLHEMPARLQLDSLRSWPLRDGRTYYKLLDQTRSDGAYSLTYKPDRTDGAR